MEKHRPLGVTAIVILTLIGGIAFVAIGTVLLVVGIGFALIAISIGYFVMAYDLWTGKRWACTITLILSGIIIKPVIIYYLYTPNVKAIG